MIPTTAVRIRLSNKATSQTKSKPLAIQQKTTLQSRSYIAASSLVPKTKLSQPNNTMMLKTGNQRNVFDFFKKKSSSAPPPPITFEEKVKSKPDMFCFQCEQTKDASGCTTIGVCGKTPTVASQQDYLIFQLKALSHYLHQYRLLGGEEIQEINVFTLKSVFSTLTNVNFDESRFHNEYCLKAAKYIQQAKENYEALAKAKGAPLVPLPSAFRDALVDQPVFDSSSFYSSAELAMKGKEIGIVKRMESHGPAKDHLAIQELITYGLKGLCAYAEHAEILGQFDNQVIAFVHEALAYLTLPEAYENMEKLLSVALKVGEMNLKVMSLLEAGANEQYGKPVPTQVRTTAVKGNCILVSGHDLKDLEKILEQSKDSNVNVYTHGELLPAHSYPGLKSKYPHLVGNWGGAWQNQKTDFAAFPGPIVMTTNCLIEPRKSYMDRIFTTSVTGWPGVKHVDEKKDFSSVVSLAKQLEGFKEDIKEEKALTTGYGKHTILNNAEAVIGAINAGLIKRFFVIGGCDGAEAERNYFGDLASSLPSDTMILTLGCGKYRFNSKELGNIGPFPRVLDMGQCNDAIGAIEVAVALSKAYNTDVNSLPLSFAISWFEQKAVAVLLTLLHLGIRNIRLGPNLPAFIPPSTLNLLVEKFNIAPCGEVKVDLSNMMQGH